MLEVASRVFDDMGRVGSAVRIGAASLGWATDAPGGETWLITTEERREMVRRGG